MKQLLESRLGRQLSQSEQCRLVSEATVRRLKAGERVFEEGDSPDGLYVVLSGEVEITVRSTPGREHVLSRSEPGDYFGEMAVFDGGTRSASATARKDTELSFVPTDTVHRLLDRSPMLAAALVRDASLRMRDFNQRFLRESLRAERLTLVERLAKTIVHDFRNPLNVIGLAADIASQEQASRASRLTARDRIQQQVAILNSLMQELLDFTRSTPPNVALPRVDYATVLRGAIIELRAEANRRGVEAEIMEPLPSVLLRCDPPRLNRVFTNLVQNALDAVSSESPGQITLRFEVTRQEVSTELSDNGTGVPVEILPHVFEPFVTFGKAHGTGLGLAICERIVLEHNGRIFARNNSGRGAVFGFTLPIEN